MFEKYFGRQTRKSEVVTSVKAEGYNEGFPKKEELMKYLKNS